jgi:hypothetical protein
MVHVNLGVLVLLSWALGLGPRMQSAPSERKKKKTKNVSYYYLTSEEEEHRIRAMTCYLLRR